MPIRIKYYENEYDFNMTDKDLFELAHLTTMPCDKFNTITVLDISKSDITDSMIDQLPIPPNLEEFNCTGCYLSKLPKFNEGLKKLSCSANNLSYLPDDLPESLEEIGCSENKMVHLYEDYECTEWDYKLPNLKTFCCQYNPLVYIPKTPKSLVCLACHGCAIEDIGELSSSLTYLECRNNKLSCLNDIPKNLTYLNCSYNNINTLGSLPDTLSSLICDFNRLRKLPKLPKSLRLLECNHNYLFELPDLPDNMTILNSAVNNLTSLPVLPTNIQQVYVSYNNISELPKRIEHNRKLFEFSYKNNPVYDVYNVRVNWDNKRPIIKRKTHEGIQLGYETAKKRKI